ncbi:MAG: family 78 glycoside hydrolase catalytic domain [Clostridia bacterium]|nr:family 78 glycoside hydrolase catalytic domain [Clostridia bacterium]
MLNSAKWIAYPGDTRYDCPLFEKQFSAKGEIKKATVTITSLGCYYAELNGRRIGKFVMAPGFTMRGRVQCQTYDVTDCIDAENTVNVYLSEGWFKGKINFLEGRQFAERTKCIIAELTLTYKDGTTETVVTDESWQVKKSKSSMVDIYDGEHYDANFEDSFVPVAVLDYDKSILVPQQGVDVIEHETVRPIEIIKTPAGETVIDFGQEVTGYFTLTVDAKKGDLVHLEFGEVLDKHGNFYRENYRTAKAEFKYVCRDGVQTHKPKLTFWGYRYIRVNAFPGELTLDSIHAIVVHSDIKRTGYLDSSNPMLNRLFKNIIWGQKGNFLDIPTDCPQRDERMGWTGDAQVFCRTASYNFDVEQFFAKWLTDVWMEQKEIGFVPHIIPQVWGTDSPSAAWADAATICPWQIYLTYGNKKILKDQFASMCGHVDSIGRITKRPSLWYGCGHFGDWLGLDAPAGSYKGSSNEDFIASVFYAYSTLLVVKAGRVLGRNVTKYENLYNRIVAKIRKTFKKYKTQTECVLALYFDIATDKAAVAKQLADMIEANGKRLKTGFVGTPYLLHALSQNGYTELAYDLLLQDQFPSWLYSVKCGATTIWEHWDGRNEEGEFWSRDMNSFNHYAYGSVADWVYGVACGIQTVEEQPGFAAIRIAPQPTDKLDHLSASIETRHGLVSSRWYHENGKVRYEITTPVKSTVVIDGKEFEVEAGSYLF